tara:strand:+ start:155 stop:739 length:585 start_codon:yes stop_codon:yes gene_type:complete
MAKFNYKDYMKNNPLLNEVQGDNDELDDSLGMKHGKKKQDMKQRRADSENMEKAKGKRKYSGDKSKDLDESYDDMDEKMAKPKSKITVKEFKASIRERILSEMGEEEMTEAEEVDVEDNEDINIDIEDDIDIDDVSDESEIEVDSELAGEDSDVAAILGLLTKAQSEAQALGDEKLMDQIGNTITYYTRAHVVK